MMNEKIVLTVEQDTALKLYKADKNTLDDYLVARSHFMNEFKTLRDFTIDEFAKLLYEPNSYEVEKPVIKVGDKVMVQWMNVKGERFYEVTKVDKYVYVKSEKHGTNFGPHDIMRHATKEEIMWAELGREVGEFVEGDVVVFDDDSSCRIEPMYPHTMVSIKGKHKKGEVKGFYPANSFIQLP